MKEYILDLHIHSKYSRACSSRLELPLIAETCKIRGIDIVATGDFTHPRWFSHMKEQLLEVGDGLYGVKNLSTKFLIATEVACIKKHKGKTRRIHLLLFAPTLGVAEKFNNVLSQRGFNIRSDGRPILGITSKDLLSLMLETDERMVVIPAHAWTPWFGIFGSKGGYDSLDDAFEELSSYVRAIETGLSSDPLMNWYISALDDITLISNSDAHSPQKLGREANVMQFSESHMSYDEIMRVIQKKDKENFLYTIEFYPEEGKYHNDGHRDCKFSCSAIETKNKYKGICPVCKRSLTIGVDYRVHELADRSVEDVQKIRDTQIPYKSLVPLPEIIGDSIGKGVATKSVQHIYEMMIEHIGSEFFILLHADLKQVEDVAGQVIADALDRVRRGDIFIRPGYDGEFGVVKVFPEDSDIRPGQIGFDIETQL